jgi:hypothetical protein
MNAERVPAEAVLAMRRIAAFIANMISIGGCALAGFAEAGALVLPTSVDGAPQERKEPLFRLQDRTSVDKSIIMNTIMC